MIKLHLAKKMDVQERKRVLKIKQEALKMNKFDKKVILLFYRLSKERLTAKRCP